MKRILTAIAVLLAACVTVFAQGKYQVKGVVEDAMGPVIGATVLEAGTTNGVSTGLDGDFVLTVSRTSRQTPFPQSSLLVKTPTSSMRLLSSVTVP